MISVPKETLDALFPLPPPFAAMKGKNHSILPAPGQTADSAQALVELLKENHKRYHIYFNDMGFHKYVHAFPLLLCDCFRSLTSRIFNWIKPSDPSYLCPLRDGRTTRRNRGGVQVPFELPEGCI